MLFIFLFGENKIKGVFVMNNLILMAVKTADGEVLPSMLFWPILVLFVTMFLCMFLIYLKNRFNQQTAKALIITAIIICVAAAIVCLSLITTYYNREIKNNADYADVNNYLKNAPLYISSICLIALSLAIVFSVGKNTTFEFDSRSVAFAAVCIAMSFALSYVRLFKLPQGGSVTLASLLPVMIFSYIFGIKKGYLVGIIYGVLQAIQDPYIIHPAQFLLDYPIAFSAIAFAGVFAEVKSLKKLPQVSFILGAIFTGIARYLCHFFSGAFAFGAYGIADYNSVYTYSLAYNSFVFVDIVIVIVIGAILFSSPAFVKEVIERQRNRIQPVLGQTDTLNYDEDNYTVEVVSHDEDFDLIEKPDTNNKSNKK